MAVALRASSIASSTGGVFSASADATLALGVTAQADDVVVVAFGVSANRSVVSVVDNNANNFTLLVGAQRSDAFITEAVYFLKVASGTVTSVTVELDGTVGTDSALVVGAFTGLAASSIAGDTDTDITTSAAIKTSPSVTTTVADGLLVAAIVCDASRTVSVADPDYVSVLAFNGGSFSFVFDYRILSATETNNHTIELNNTCFSAHVIGELRGDGARRFILVRP